MTWVAFTPHEGEWPFTESDTPHEAIRKLAQAIRLGEVLSIPFDNPINAVEFRARGQAKADDAART